MSSLATEPRRAASGLARARALTGAGGLRASANATLALALVAALAALSFATRGGVDLAANTDAEIALTAIGAVLGVSALLLAEPGRAWGVRTLCLFGALAALSLASIAWSVQPADSWVEANRTISYLAAFGGALALARLVPRRWPALAAAVALLCTLISAYVLLLKVFPGSLARDQMLGRVTAPFDYWNATGLLAALGLPACLWAGARREAGVVPRVLAVPSVAVLVAVVLLSYSRSALLAAVCGLAFWFISVPLRLRAAALLALGVTGGALVSWWALGHHAITHDNASIAARTSAGHTFGLILVLTLGLLVLTGIVAVIAIDRLELSARARRRVGIALVVLVGLIPIGGVGALAASSRGLTGGIAHAWNTLTNPVGGVGDSPGRLVQLGSSRPRYWSDGLVVGEHALFKGVGALGYATARTRYTRDWGGTRHAHSYVIETFADFGLLGSALSLALLVTWGLAAARAVDARIPWPVRRLSASAARRPPGPTAERRPPERTAERAGLLTLLAVVLIFGVHSTIDWTWFVPGTAIPALLCAGWLAGRGPLAKPLGRARVRGGVQRGAVVGSVVIVAVAVLASWIIWQPSRSASADAAALSAMARGNTKAALADVRVAAERNPFAAEPLWDRSVIDFARGEPGTARADLVRAVQLQPANPTTWLDLGLFDLQQHDPQSALAALKIALRLHLGSTETAAAVAQAQHELGTRVPRAP